MKGGRFFPGNSGQQFRGPDITCPQRFCPVPFGKIFKDAQRVEQNPAEPQRFGIP
ncbi:MAG: hypothetical protein LBD78_04265 [Spirochaetaceae bacterium]|jgi:hypothetical protein|nr:hypothetical protein [Spirochaetaceae bacterium]